MWRWVRKWLWDDWETQPKAAPVLVAELYGPHALAIYRALRLWEDAWSEYFEDHPNKRSNLVRELARDVRRFLLALQRLRFLAARETSGLDSVDADAHGFGERPSPANSDLARATPASNDACHGSAILEPGSDGITQSYTRLWEQKHLRPADRFSRAAERLFEVVPHTSLRSFDDLDRVCQALRRLLDARLGALEFVADEKA